MFLGIFLRNVSSALADDDAEFDCERRGSGEAPLQMDASEGEPLM